MPTIDFRGPKIYSLSAKSTRIGPKVTPKSHKVNPSRYSKIFIQTPRIGSQGPKIDCWMERTLKGLSINYKMQKLDPLKAQT